MLLNVFILTAMWLQLNPLLPYSGDCFESMTNQDWFCNILHDINEYLNGTNKLHNIAESIPLKGVTLIRLRLTASIFFEQPIGKSELKFACAKLFVMRSFSYILLYSAVILVDMFWLFTWPKLYLIDCEYMCNATEYLYSASSE